MKARLFRLGKAILAVERNGEKPTAITVPEGALIQVEGELVAADSRMEYVRWCNRRLEMFGVDIEERAEEVTSFKSHVAH